MLARRAVASADPTEPFSDIRHQTSACPSRRPTAGCPRPDTGPARSRTGRRGRSGAGGGCVAFPAWNDHSRRVVSQPRARGTRRGYYARVSWIGSDLGTPFNQLIRSGGEQEAADGPAALAVRVAACIRQLRDTLPGARTRPVRRPTWGAWSISFDDFVTSRMLELVIHCDDLACSVGLPVPAFPPQAVETVVDILSRIALRRHGATDVLRALSRSERAPVSISAL